MYELSLGDFKNIEGAEFKNIPTAADTFFGVSIDSRTIKKNEIFWAIKGERFDGHDFVNTAIKAGALFAVVERGFNYETLPAVVTPDTLKSLQTLANVHRNKFDIPVIAITGSNGKTTLKEMLAQILQSDKQVLKTEGNLNNHIGCPLTLLRLKEKHQAAIVELGSNHPGEIDVLAKISEPTHAVISNIGEAHLEFFKNKEGVFKEKTSLFDDMKSGTHIFINMNDPWLRKYEAENGQRIIRYAFDEDADVQGTDLKVDKEGRASFVLNAETEIHLLVAGIHNAYNALAASAVALSLGYDETAVKTALQSYRAFDKRMQRVELNGAEIINDCYNASPDSMQAAIDTVSRIHTDGSVYLLLGDMFELGETALQAHKRIIEKALNVERGYVFLLGETMKKAADNLKNENMRILNSNEEAASILKKLIKPGDLVLIKGSRGMKMEEIIELMKKA
jgi:UDP-N-acetylmuramoyl-tripeptide--D-alanyl-D-alanine ligase